MEDQKMPMHGESCQCPHHQVIPVLIILFGLVFLLAGLHILTWGFANIVWPILVIIGGFTKLGSGKCGCCHKA